MQVAPGSAAENQASYFCESVCSQCVCSQCVESKNEKDFSKTQWNNVTKKACTATCSDCVETAAKSQGNGRTHTELHRSKQSRPRQNKEKTTRSGKTYRTAHSIAREELLDSIGLV
jgi:hypothetical protein